MTSDETREKVVRVIAHVLKQGRRARVSDIMLLSGIKSRNTVDARLRELELEGAITVNRDYVVEVTWISADAATQRARKVEERRREKIKLAAIEREQRRTGRSAKSLAERIEDVVANAQRVVSNPVDLLHYGTRRLSFRAKARRVG